MTLLKITMTLLKITMTLLKITMTLLKITMRVTVTSKTTTPTLTLHPINLIPALKEVKNNNPVVVGLNGIRPLIYGAQHPEIYVLKSILELICSNTN
jgi:hypothetical protein